MQLRKQIHQNIVEGQILLNIQHVNSFNKTQRKLIITLLNN